MNNVTGLNDQLQYSQTRGRTFDAANDHVIIFLVQTKANLRAIRLHWHLPSNSMYVWVRRQGEVKVDNIGNILEVYTSGDSILPVPVKTSYWGQNAKSNILLIPVNTSYWGQNAKSNENLVRLLRNLLIRCSSAVVLNLVAFKFPLSPRIYSKAPLHKTWYFPSYFSPQWQRYFSFFS